MSQFVPGQVIGNGAPPLIPKTETVPGVKFATYRNCPSGLTATPPGLTAVLQFVPHAIGVSEPLALIVKGESLSDPWFAT